MDSKLEMGVQTLSMDEIDAVSGGAVFLAPAVYAAFVSGAKWGAGIALATYAIQAR